MKVAAWHLWKAGREHWGNGIFPACLQAHWEINKNLILLGALVLGLVGCSEDPDSPRCGDGQRDESEQCDDGNGHDGDGCSATCTLELAEVALNELVATPGDAGNDWVEMLNLGEQPVLLSDWSVRDEAGNQAKLSSLDEALEPGAFVVFTLSDALGWGLGKGDTLSLLDPSGAVVDSTSWEAGDAPEGRSWGRLPDGSGSWQGMMPTPGASNGAGQSCGNEQVDSGELCDGREFQGQSCTSFGYEGGVLRCIDCVALDFSACTVAVSDIVLNEISSSADTVELYNRGQSPQALSGLRLVDRPVSESARDFVIFEGQLQPGEFVVYDLAVLASFGLGAEDMLSLRDGSGKVLDLVEWPKDQADPSWCRIPDGDGDWEACEASFGAANAQ
ncbi:MAG: lamin tail domain-containing protein [Myxococcota bacterium]|jgi:cysteine-rich repeat protein|nr:lamin tail domain-containing protein [Myxococcota bacterium]